MLYVANLLEGSVSVIDVGLDPTDAIQGRLPVSACRSRSSR